MTQLVVTDIETNGLSAAGVNVLKAALIYASRRHGVKSHALPLDEFCALAGTGMLSGDGMRVLLYEAQRALACIQVVDTDVRIGDVMPEKTAPMFDYVSANDSSVVFEFSDFVLQRTVLDKVLTLAAPRRR